MNLSRRMNRANARKGFGKAASSAPQATAAATFDAIFCDCLGTLFGYNFDKDEVLVNYLNAQSRNGKEVIVFSTNLRQQFRDTTILERVRSLGLDHTILESLADKSSFYGETLQVLIDDDPSPLLKAVTKWHPKDPAFRQHMQYYLNKHGSDPAPDL